MGSSILCKNKNEGRQRRFRRKESEYCRESQGSAPPAGGGPQEVVHRALSRAWLPPLLKDPAEGTPSCAGKGMGWGAPAINTRVSYYIRHSLWELQFKKKKKMTWPTTFLRRKSLRKGDFWLLALSKVRNKGRSCAP